MATRYVRYVGPVHRRVISETDWRAARLKGNTVGWEASNGFAVPLDQFSEDQIKRAISTDPNFVITAEDEEFQPTPGPYDMTPREHRQWVENPVDVPALLDGHAAGSVDLSQVPSVPSDAAPNGNVRTEEPEDSRGPNVGPSDKPSGTTSGGSKASAR
jgi:hypothetical protein